MNAKTRVRLNTGYRVFVDDNYHYMDENERTWLGDFETYEEALQAAKEIVDNFFKKGMVGRPAEELFKEYKSFGEDAFISAIGDAVVVPKHFSAWNYAREISEGVSKGTIIPERKMPTPT